MHSNLILQPKNNLKIYINIYIGIYIIKNYKYKINVELSFLLKTKLSTVILITHTLDCLRK